MSGNDHVIKQRMLKHNKWELHVDCFLLPINCWGVLPTFCSVANFELFHHKDTHRTSIKQLLFSAEEISPAFVMVCWMDGGTTKGVELALRGIGIWPLISKLTCMTIGSAYGDCFTEEQSIKGSKIQRIVSHSQHEWMNELLLSLYIGKLSLYFLLGLKWQ